MLAQTVSIDSNTLKVAVKHSSRDTSYITDFYSRHFILRLYESTKFNNYKFIDHDDRLIYKPNTHNNLGIGFSYKFIDLNLGFYMPFISKNRNKYGVTHYLDLQTHAYLHHFAIDFYGQFYKGYYLSNPVTALNVYPTDGFPQRPNMHNTNISLVVQYIFNDNHFSYNAPFYQNEYQKKSAGSFIVGGGIYYARLKDDSAIIPANIRYTNFYNNNDFNITSNTGLGISIGYAYTWVIHNHFFVTGSLNGGTGISYNVLKNNVDNNHDNKFGPSYNLNARFAAGYNSYKYFIGVNYVRFVIENSSPYPHTWQETNAGNFRFIIARRFTTKKKTILDDPKIIPVKLQ